MLLPLASRAQADESPREGWCGETAAQEGLLHLGAYVSQAAIHRAGNPSHADLYSHELPVALSALGVRFTRFPGGGYGAFVAWVREALGRSAPVLAGVKLLPTQHPEWGLDHFVLVVGEGEPGLLVDTTWGTREWSNDKKTRGISFVNAGYGLRFIGLELPRGVVAARPARLVVRREDATTVSLRATCAAGAAAAGTHASTARIVCRKNPRAVEAFLTSAPDVSGFMDLDVPRAQSAWCVCVGDP